LNFQTISHHTDTIMHMTFQKSPVILLALFLISILQAQGQQVPLSYYLPQIGYDNQIETPQDFIGFTPGEWHLGHDQVVYYSKYLAEKSPRVIFSEYARSYENRPLFHLIISHPDNLDRLEEIQQAHKDLATPGKSVNIDNLPSVINLGYSVHGNEQSGVGAAVIMSYYLAAGKDPYLDSLLLNTVILLDPCLNPDGMNRFSSWVNMHKSKNLVSANASREFNEPWPGSRTNHYWFDLNRDWLPVVHPESRGRIKVFQNWLPNIVCDYHEMGTNSTYFFQPGVPSRNNPLTPAKTFELTEQVAGYHAKYLDKIGSLYYSRESFDDFYFGKGSTYPDINGSIGILFEQASSRGHLQDSKFGPLSYAFTIRNQVYASFSSLEAAFRMRKELLSWKQDFYKTALDEAKKHPIKGYLLPASEDFSKTLLLLDILEHHNIDVFVQKENYESNGKRYDVGGFLVPLEQRQYRLIRGIFDTQTEFQDSLFYDVSSWTLPLGMDIDYLPIRSYSEVTKLKGEPFSLKDIVRRPEPVPVVSYAYALEWKDYFSPAVLNKLLENEFRVLFTTKPTTISTHRGDHEFAAGSLIIPLQIQDKTPEQTRDYLQRLVNMYGCSVFGINSGKAKEGIDLGSPGFSLIKPVQVAILAGNGMFSNEVGEAWHLLDQRFDMKAMILDANQFSWANWSSITHLIVTSGSPDLSDNQVAKLKEWVQSGGTIIGINRGNNWLKSKGLAFLTTVDKSSEEKPDGERRPYENQPADRGAGLLSGAIFSIDIDRTHPLFYGYERDHLHVFHRGTDFFKSGKNAYSTPAVYSEKALISGYVPKAISANLSGHAAVVISGIGSGKVISILDNPLFRGYWTGTHRMFMNAIFFGPEISGSSVERN